MQANLFHQEGVFVKPSASIHQFLILSQVNIQYDGDTFQAGFQTVLALEKGIRKPQLPAFRLIAGSVVEYDIPGSRERNSGPGVNVQFSGFDIPGIQAGKIENSSQRHIWNPGGLDSGIPGVLPYFLL